MDLKKNERPEDISNLLRNGIWALTTIAITILGLLVYAESGAGESDVDISTANSIADRYPGEDAFFYLNVTNNGDEADDILLTIPLDDRNWTTFNETGEEDHTVHLNASETEIVVVVVKLPQYRNSTGEDKEALENTSYPLCVKAETSGDEKNDTQNLTVNILQIFAADMWVVGEDHAEVYITADVSDSSNDEIFTIQVKNLGNGKDGIYLNVEYSPNYAHFDVEFYNDSTGSGHQLGYLYLSAGSTETVYLFINFDERNSPGLFNIFLNATPGYGTNETVQTNVTVYFHHPHRELDLVGDDVTIVPNDNKPSSAEENTARIELRVTNQGEADEKFNCRRFTYYMDWQFGFWTTMDEATEWSDGDREIASLQTRSIWLIVHVDPDSAVGNYTIDYGMTVDGDYYDVEANVTIQVQEPIHSLDLFTLDSKVEFTPKYQGTPDDNRVKFRIMVENTGDYSDTFIPDIESTLEDDWVIQFFQDSVHSVEWPRTGVDIDSGDTNDLWVCVEVDDRAYEGNYSITILVRDDEDAASANITLYVVILLPDLAIETSDIQLEVNGMAVVDPSTIRGGDALVVLADIHNQGDSDAEVLVEIYIRPNRYIGPEEIEELEAMGFEEDEERYWILYLYRSNNTFRANTTKQIMSNEWLVESGKWYFGVQVDYDPDYWCGRVVELFESTNAARYPYILQILPDLSIKSMRISDNYVTKAPNVGDVVTFTVVVKNNGTADVSNARLYIWNYQFRSIMLQMKSPTKHYATFDIAAMYEKTVHFRWEAKLGNWTDFRAAEVNPKCSDIDESDNSDCDDFTDRFIDEMDRYDNNEYPAQGEVFKQVIGGENITVEFPIWPDFIIKEINLDPPRPVKDLEEAAVITVMIENLGAADWEPSIGVLKLKVEDGQGWESELDITRGIDAGDEEGFAFDDKWDTPDKDRVNLTFRLDYEGYEIENANNEYHKDIEFESNPTIEEEEEEGEDSGFLSYPSTWLSVGTIALVVMLFNRRRRK